MTNPPLNPAEAVAANEVALHGTAGTGTDDGRRPKVASPVRSTIKHVLLISAALAMIYPLLWMLVSSFRPTEVIFREPGLWLTDPIFDNYTQGWTALQHPFNQYLMNR